MFRSLRVVWGDDQAEVKSSNTVYMEAHPEIRAILNDFMSAVLVAKPAVRGCGLISGEGGG